MNSAPKENASKHNIMAPDDLTLPEVIQDLVIRFIMNCPEEEFDSLDRLFFHIEEAHWFYEDFYKELSNCLPTLSFKKFVGIIFKQCPILSPHTNEMDQHTQSFYDYKKSVPVFGAIILNKTRDKVLLVKGWSSKMWSFPRGKVNQGETDMVCAAREVKEEIGFDISSHLDERRFLKVVYNQQIVQLFIVTDISETVHFHPETRKEVSDIQWHSISTVIGDRPLLKPRKWASRYWAVGPFMPKLKKWLQNNPRAIR